MLSSPPRLVLLLAALLRLTPANAAPACYVYVGTYTDWELFGPPRRNPPGERSQGIYVFRFDPETGKLSQRQLAAATDNPTYVTFAPSGKTLYAVNEVYRFHGEATGAVSAFSIDATSGRLAFVNQVAAHGTGTCHATVDATGRNLLLANFGSGSVGIFPVEPNGALRPASASFQDSGAGPNPRQVTPHSHAFNLSPDNRLAIASEFSTDRLLLYRFDAAAGTLIAAEPSETKLKPGSAPRHLAFHPSGAFAYSVNEIDSTVTVLRYDAAKGTLTALETLSTLPPDFSGRNTAAEVVVHPSGKFLYASNRGHHSIAVFAIGPDGRLRAGGHVSSGGRTPRGFSVDPSGRWLIAANQDTHNLAVFSLDPVTGLPRPTGQSEEVRGPVCVKFLTLP
jgi:6-phosphogluconolactonase